MKFRQRRSRGEPQIAAVSFIDVVLQLVIFLLLTTTFKSAEAGLDVSLPDARTASAIPSGGVVVEIDVDGRLSVGGKVMEKEELADLFRQEADRDTGSPVLIRADRKAPHGDVVDVMELARRSDLRKLAIAAVTGRGMAGGHLLPGF